MPASRRQWYRVVRGPLFYPTDPDIVRRLAEGVDLRWFERANREAVTGEIVDDIPTMSVPSLLAKGWIELVDPSEVGDG